MSTFNQYMSLIEQIALLTEVERRSTDGSLKRKERKKYKQAAPHNLAKVLKEIKSIVTNMLNTVGREKLRSRASADFDELRHSIKPEGVVHLDRLQGLFFECVKKESNKSPFRRQMERYSLVIFFVIVFAISCSVQWSYLVDVTDPIDTRKGFVQRAMTFEKLLDYNKAMEGRARRNGWVQSIFYWHIKPTDTEMKYVNEFANANIKVLKYYVAKKVLCVNGPPDSKTVSTQVLGYILNPANAKAIATQTAGTGIISLALASSYSCAK
jgi:hypothetical protein